jgi:hypothetical protein
MSRQLRPPQGGQSIQARAVGSGLSIQQGPHGLEVCTNYGTKCVSTAGTTQNNLASMYLGISASKVAEAARLQSGGYTVYGVDARDAAS